MHRASLRARRRTFIRRPSMFELATASARSRNRASGSRFTARSDVAFRLRTAVSTSTRSAVRTAGRSNSCPTRGSGTYAANRQGRRAARVAPVGFLGHMAHRRLVDRAIALIERQVGPRGLRLAARVSGLGVVWEDSFDSRFSVSERPKHLVGKGAADRGSKAHSVFRRDHSGALPGQSWPLENSLTGVNQSVVRARIRAVRQEVELLVRNP